MDKYDPSTWEAHFIKKNRKECIAVLEMLTATLQKNLSNRNYVSAMQCCNKACAGFDAMVKVWGIKQYGGLMYTYSYLLAEIAMFGIGGEKGKIAALPLLQTALDYARDYINSVGQSSENAKRCAENIKNMMNDIKLGYSLVRIREKYAPSFPDPWLA